MNARVGNTQNLTREEELELARAWRDRKDERARARILAAYYKMAVGFASKSLRPGMVLDDLIQVANIGLIMALDRFDPDLGFGFSTFARYYVISGLQVHALENTGPVRIFNTAASKALLAGYFHLRRRFEDPSTGKISELAREKICQELNIDLDQIQRFEMAMAVPVGIDAGAGEIDEDGTSKGHVLTAQENPEEETTKKRSTSQARDALRIAMSKLDPRDAEILVKRHLNDPTQTLDAVALDLGISRERVRQLEMRALRQIREHLLNAGVDGAGAFFG